MAARPKAASPTLETSSFSTGCCLNPAAQLENYAPVYAALQHAIWRHRTGPASPVALTQRTGGRRTGETLAAPHRVEELRRRRPEQGPRAQRGDATPEVDARIQTRHGMKHGNTNASPVASSQRIRRCSWSA